MASDSVDQLVDHRLDLGVRAGVVDDAAQLGDLASVEAGAEASVEQRGVGGGRAVEGQRDQHGALALDQVVAGGLAGGGRVAEDAEQVVAQLEGLAERQPERRELGAASPVRPPARAAPMWSGRSMEYLADL